MVEIEKKLSRLKVVLRSAPAGIEVKLDGSVLRTAALGTPLPLDPGAHTLEVTAPRHNGWTRSIAMAAGPKDDADKLCTSDGCTQTGLDTHDEARDAATLSTITLGVGVVMLAAGVYFVFFPPGGTRAQAAKLGPGTLVGPW